VVITAKLADFILLAGLLFFLVALNATRILAPPIYLAEEGLQREA
jgi:hypothetical protein